MKHEYYGRIRTFVFIRDVTNQAVQLSTFGRTMGEPTLLGYRHSIKIRDPSVLARPAPNIILTLSSQAVIQICVGTVFKVSKRS